MESSVAQLVKLSVTVSRVDGSPPAGFFFIFSFHFSLYRLRNMMFPFYDKPSGKTVKYFTIAFFLLLSHFRENGNDALPKSSIFSQLIYRFTICVNKFLSVSNPANYNEMSWHVLKSHTRSSIDRRRK